MPVFRAMQRMNPKPRQRVVKLKSVSSLLPRIVNQPYAYGGINNALIVQGTISPAQQAVLQTAQQNASPANAPSTALALNQVLAAQTPPSGPAPGAIQGVQTGLGGSTGAVQFISSNSSTTNSTILTNGNSGNYVMYNQTGSAFIGSNGVSIVGTPVRRWTRIKVRGKWKRILVDTALDSTEESLAYSGFANQKKEINRLIRNILDGIGVSPRFKKSADKRLSQGERLAFKPQDVEAFRIREGTKLLLPHGVKLVTDKRGNFKVYDKHTKVIRAGANNLDFNKYLNASDLLEQFIKDLGVAGVTQSKVLKVPIHAFINWIILKSAEADDIPPPPDIPKLEALSDVMELKAQPTSNSKCKCIRCGHFLSETMERMGMKFCKGSCMNAYVRKMKKYEKKLPCCI